MQKKSNLVLTIWYNPSNQEDVKDSRDNSHYEQSSQQSSQDSTKDQMDLVRRRTGHRLEYQLFFLLVLLKDKNMFVNKLGSL